MLLPETTLKIVIKDKVIPLTLKYQDKFKNTLSNNKKDLTELSNNSEKIQLELQSVAKIMGKTAI